jgi:hypothetical protein
VIFDSPEVVKRIADDSEPMQPVVDYFQRDDVTVAMPADKAAWAAGIREIVGSIACVGADKVPFAVPVRFAVGYINELEAPLQLLER